MFSPKHGAPTAAAGAGQALTSQLRRDDMKKPNFLSDMQSFLSLERLFSPIVKVSNVVSFLAVHHMYLWFIHMLECKVQNAFDMQLSRALTLSNIDIHLVSANTNSV